MHKDCAVIAPPPQTAQTVGACSATSGQELPNRRQSLRTGAANFSASGLKRQDNDLIAIESAAAAAAFKHACDVQYDTGEALAAGAKR
jgi:hypothetical protein